MLKTFVLTGLLVAVSILIGTSTYWLFILYGFDVVRPVSYHDLRFQLTAYAGFLFLVTTILSIPASLVFWSLQRRKKAILSLVMINCALFALCFNVEVADKGYFPNPLSPAAITVCVPGFLALAIFTIGFQKLLSWRDLHLAR